jgi:hypothetical protein
MWVETLRGGNGGGRVGDGGGGAGLAGTGSPTFRSLISVGGRGRGGGGGGWVGFLTPNNRVTIE